MIMGFVWLLSFTDFPFSSPECLWTKGVAFRHAVVIPLQTDLATQEICCFCQAGWKPVVKAQEGSISQARKKKGKGAFFGGPVAAEEVWQSVSLLFLCLCNNQRVGSLPHGTEAGMVIILLCFCWVFLWYLLSAVLKRQNLQSWLRTWGYIQVPN